MITIKINNIEKKYDDIEDIDKKWINQQINRRRDDNQEVCVRVFIDEKGIKISLSTSTCQSSGGGGRPPNTKEQAIFDLWKNRGLKDKDFTGGKLIAFFRQLKKIV